MSEAEWGGGRCSGVAPARPRRVSTGARGSVRVSFRLELDNGVFALTVKGNIYVESDVKWSWTQ